MFARRGVLAFLLLFGLVGLAVLFAALRLSAPSRMGSRPTVLTFDVPQDLDESEPPFPRFSLRGLRREELTLFDVVRAIHAAADDDHVESLVLHIDGLGWGCAKLAAVRDALRDFGESGKPVYASLHGDAGEREYLLASVADVVSMPPTVALEIDG